MRPRATWSFTTYQRRNARTSATSFASQSRVSQSLSSGPSFLSLSRGGFIGFFFVLSELQDFLQALPQLFGFEVVFQAAFVAQGHGARFLAHHQRHGIGLFSDA